MEAVTISAVAAIVAIATALGNGFASAASKDAYIGLKHLISRRFIAAEAVLLEVEANPSHTIVHDVLATRLEEAGASQDAEFREGVQVLLKALLALRNEPAAAPLLDFGVLQVAGRFEMTDISASGTVMKSGTMIVKGDMKLVNIHQTRSVPEKH